MNIAGKYSFKILCEESDFSRIETMLGMKASKTIVKGQKISPSRYAPATFWSFSLSFSEEDEVSDVMKRFLKVLSERKQEIKILSAEHEVEIAFFLRSDYGQMGFMMDRECLSMLNEIGAPVDVHILSFGMAE